MANKAIQLVQNYIAEHMDKSNLESEPKLYLRRKCRGLHNWKYYVISTDSFGGMYYEVIYNGAKKEWYLDAYKKIEHLIIED